MSKLKDRKNISNIIFGRKRRGWRSGHGFGISLGNENRAESLGTAVK